MIWNFFETLSAFDKHFQNPDLTLETLLLDETIITQLKNMHPKLIEYLNKHKQRLMISLIEYVTVLPRQEDGHQRCHQLPYISSQLLSINSGLILNEFINSEHYIELLFQLLKSQSIHNEVLLGYFQKVMNNLCLTNNATKAIAANVNLFLNGLKYKPISDILKKSIVLINTPQNFLLNERIHILNSVIQIIQYGQEDIKENCIQILVQIIDKFQTFSSGDALLEIIWKNPNTINLFKNQESDAVAKFIIGLFKKKSTFSQLQIPKQYYQKINKFVKNYKKKLFNKNEENITYMNQSHSKIKKLNKSIPTFLILSHLCVLYCSLNKNSFIDEQLIEQLWKIIEEHSFNDIVMVGIVRLFIEVAKHEQLVVESKLRVNYHSHILQLAAKNIKMYRPHIYSLWKGCKHFGPPQKLYIVQSWNLLENQLQELVQYDIVNFRNQFQKPLTLMVDEQDQFFSNESLCTYTQKTKSSQQQKESNNITEKIQFNFDFFNFTKTNQQKQISQNQKEQNNQSKKAQKSVFEQFGDFI